MGWPVIASMPWLVIIRGDIVYSQIPRRSASSKFIVRQDALRIERPCRLSAGDRKVPVPLFCFGANREQEPIFISYSENIIWLVVISLQQMLLTYRSDLLITFSSWMREDTRRWKFAVALHSKSAGHPSSIRDGGTRWSRCFHTAEPNSRRRSAHAGPDFHRVHHLNLNCQKSYRRFNILTSRGAYPSSVPLVLGTPVMRSSFSMAIRSARAALLKIASLMWWLLRPWCRMT